MRAVKYIASAFVALAGPAIIESASAASDPIGIWLNDTGRGAIEIKQCGEALCGNVVWVKSESDANGCGKQIIGDVAPVGGGRWDNGWIYSPERGRKYSVELTPLSNGDLKVVGYSGMKFLSKTMIWKPAPADLQLCGATDTNADAPAPQKPDGETGALIAPSAPATPQPAATNEARAEPAVTTPAAETKKTVETKAPAPSKAKDAAAKNNETANSESDNGNGVASDLGNMKLGGLELDKVWTRTNSGKCKLDLPWVKVTVDCED